MKPAAILLDTSAIVAILTREAGAETLIEKLLAAEFRTVPAPCAAEASIVLNTKLRRDPGSLLQEFFTEFEIEVVAFGTHHLAWFGHGYSKFGKGRHPAALNMGDCFTYAVAKATGFPLLFTGQDFSRTDLLLA